MNVLLTVATGFIGSRLQTRLASSGHHVTVVSRRGPGAVSWDPGEIRAAVGGNDAVIHLAGENLFGRRWSARNLMRRDMICLWPFRHFRCTKFS